jgi:hypothetical protein
MKRILWPVIVCFQMTCLGCHQSAASLGESESPDRSQPAKAEARGPAPSTDFPEGRDIPAGIVPASGYYSAVIAGLMGRRAGGKALIDRAIP